MTIRAAQRTGIAGGISTGTSFTGTSTTHPGYPIYGSAASDPNDTIPTNQQQYTTSAVASAPSLTFPPDLPTAHMNFLECDWSVLQNSNAFNGGGSLTPVKMYRLPVPMQTTDTHRVVFNDGYSYAGAIGGAIQSASRAATGQGFVGQTTQQIASIIGRATGYTLNSFKGLAMEQPQFKTHTLSWKLSPKNPKESIIIQRIITGMRGGMTPEAALGRILLEFPRVFVPWFHPNTQYMYKFKPCVITGLDVDYQGGNPQPSFYKINYAPESVIINMSLLEMEYWLRKDFQKNDSSGIPNKDPFAPWNYYKFTSDADEDVFID